MGVAPGGAGTNDRSARKSLGYGAGRTVRPPQNSSLREALIRTLSVGLIALAAIVASLSVVKQRQEDALPPEGEKRPQHLPASSSVNLDQLRAAGM